jgi:hypothetical protein
VPLDCIASLPHYADHLIPIWAALPPEARSTFWVHPSLAGRFPAEQMATLNIRPSAQVLSADLTLVASYSDLRRTNRRPAILAQHGAGQAYKGDPRNLQACNAPWYPGGARHENVELFLCPSQRVADLWLDRYPKTSAAIVGCPKMGPIKKSINSVPLWDNGPDVLLAWTWGAQIGCPETQTAFPFFESILPELTRRFGVVGTCHPRVESRICPIYAKNRIPFLRGDSVFQNLPGVVVADNTSIAWEMASLGVPVIWLDGPFVRQHISHGLRFFPAEMPICGNPELLPKMIDKVLHDWEEESKIALEETAGVYEVPHSEAALAATNAILKLLSV